jgi:ankyrin repeat protein
MCDSVCVLKLMQDVYGYTPLIQACQRGHVETARVLLDHGAATDYRNKVNSLRLTKRFLIMIVTHQQLP